MPKISLWNPDKGNDYQYGDKILRNYFDQSGTGVYVHKYIGPASGGDETTISDILFMENRSRRYSDEIYEMRGTYQPQSSDFNLSQFGIFITNDTIFLMFHYTEMLNILGRKLMSGDVLELPHLADPDTLDQGAPTSHRFYTVVEGAHASEGFGPTWWSHIWRVKLKQTPAAPEYAGIVAGERVGGSETYGIDLLNPSAFAIPGTIIDKDGNVVGETCGGSRQEIEQGITDGIIAEAYNDVRFDPKQFDAAHLWIEEDVASGKYYAHAWSMDTLPANGQPLHGSGDTFDQSAPEGAFFLRTDFDTNRLYRKSGNIWVLLERDLRKTWTGYNKILDTFIDNVETDIMSDGTEVKTKKALSQTVRPSINLHQDKEDEIIKNNGKK